jgi:thymidylate synthase (FAD)
VDDAPEIFAPEAWRGRPAEVKQGSGAALAELSAPDDVYAKAVAEAGLAYERLLAIGVAPEQARMVLPMAAMTEWFWSGSLAAWGRMCQLRQAPDAQAEAREVANQVATICVERFPISWAALRGWRPKAETGDAA